ncbi:lachesin-like [Macrobrachium rosenbergii]|uniref:lachesin-like n=1 Tax=Macrobrachium rosenbergii TaxID=79674 RepID=UPI0034D658D8
MKRKTGKRKGVQDSRDCCRDQKSAEEDSNMKDERIRRRRRSRSPGAVLRTEKKLPAGRQRRWPATLLVAVVSSTLLAFPAAAKVDTPVFLEPISNVTMPAGREVRLACVVDHLGSYKLAWIQKDRSAILTVGNHVITRNNRIGVSHDGHRTWYLTIRDLRPGDAGTYMCQINTEIAISQIGHVTVVVPPYIKDDMSSRDVRLTENTDVTLACSARGSPVPTIKWKREDNEKIKINLTMSAMEVAGPLLHLTHLTRTDMAAYLCIATNGIPPSVSKRIEVEVKFIPTVYAPHQLIGVHIGQDVTLECYIEAWPPGLNYWMRPNGIQVLHTDKKYEVKEVAGSQKYKTHMLLTIREVSKADIGEYNCIANNSQGGAEQVVRISASVPIQHNHNSINKGGREEKNKSYGKPLSAVNWSKEKEASTSAKEELSDLRKSSQSLYNSNNLNSNNNNNNNNHHQRHTNNKLLNFELEGEPSFSASPPSSCRTPSPAGTSLALCCLLANVLLLRGGALLLC